LEDHKLQGFRKEWWDSVPQYQKEQLLDIFLQADETHFTEEAEKAPEDSQHRQVMLDWANYFHNRRPSVQKQRMVELEQMERDFEARQKAIQAANRFVSGEIRRMNALPEPIFVLDLPDDVIRSLVSTKFDTVGKLLFGIMVDCDRLVSAISDENQIDVQAAQWVYREQLLKAVGTEGYNLIGSRLMQFGYLQRNHFLSELKNETAHKPRRS
jgi:hypothetical protein